MLSCSHPALSCSGQPPWSEGHRGPLHDGRLPPRGERLDQNGRQRGETRVGEERVETAGAHRAVSTLLQEHRHNVAVS